MQPYMVGDIYLRTYITNTTNLLINLVPQDIGISPSYIDELYSPDQEKCLQAIMYASSFTFHFILGFNFIPCISRENHLDVDEVLFLEDWKNHKTDGIEFS